MLPEVVLLADFGMPDPLEVVSATAARKLLIAASLQRLSGTGTRKIAAQAYFPRSKQ